MAIILEDDMSLSITFQVCWVHPQQHPYLISGHPILSGYYAKISASDFQVIVPKQLRTKYILQDN